MRWLLARLVRRHIVTPRLVAALNVLRGRPTVYRWPHPIALTGDVSRFVAVGSAAPAIFVVSGGSQVALLDGYIANEGATTAIRVPWQEAGC